MPLIRPTTDTDGQTSERARKWNTNQEIKTSSSNQRPPHISKMKNNDGSSNERDKLTETGVDNGNTSSQHPEKVRIRPNHEEILARRKKAKTDSVVLSNAANFNDLIRTNTHWVDKTDFVRMLAKEHENIGFYFPRRFCKSTLLSMAHFFLRREVDSNGVPLLNQWTDERLLYREKFGKPNFDTSELLGSRECVHVSLDLREPADFNEFFRRITKIFFNLFADYEWLLKDINMKKNDREKFERMLNQTSDTVDLKDALLFLTELLYNHFKQWKHPPYKKVLLLIDEFDYVLRPRLQRSIPQNELDKMIMFFRGFLKATTTNNEWAQVVLVGSFPDPDMIGRVQSYTVLKAGEYAPYFGFSESEFNYLANNFAVTDMDRATARTWFNGCTLYGLKGKTFSVFNPQNVIEFLIDRKKDPDEPFDPIAMPILLEEKFNITKLANLFCKKTIARRIETLLEPSVNDQSMDIFVTKFVNDSIKALVECALDLEDDCSEEIANSFFTFLLYTGYLDAPKRNGYSYVVTIPNELHRQELTERIKNYYNNVLLKDFVKFLPSAQKALQTAYRAAQSNEKELSHLMNCFRDKMVTVLKKMPKRREIRIARLIDEAVHPNEDLFHSIFNYMALSLRSVGLFGTEVTCKCTPGFYTESESNQRSDTSFADFSVRVAVQVEHKFHKTSKVALRQSLDYFPIYKAHLKNGCVDRVLFIGINFVSGPRNVQIEHFLFKKDDQASEEAFQKLMAGSPGKKNPIRGCRSKK